MEQAVAASAPSRPARPADRQPLSRDLARTLAALPTARHGRERSLLLVLLPRAGRCTNRSPGGPRPGVASASSSTASLTHVVVEQHPEEQRQWVAAEQLVGGGVLCDAELRPTRSVPQGLPRPSQHVVAATERTWRPMSPPATAARRLDRLGSRLGSSSVSSPSATTCSSPSRRRPSGVSSNCPTTALTGRGADRAATAGSFPARVCPSMRPSPVTTTAQSATAASKPRRSRKKSVPATRRAPSHRQAKPRPPAAPAPASSARSPPRSAADDRQASRRSTRCRRPTSSSRTWSGVAAFCGPNTAAVPSARAAGWSRRWPRRARRRPGPGPPTDRSRRPA